MSKSTIEMYEVRPTEHTTTTTGLDLMQELNRAQEGAIEALVAFKTTVDEAPRASLVEGLIAWSTDPNGMDREAMENVYRDGWGIGRE